ncbi:Adaptor complexes medium subunit family protein [Trichomonas vaginalis G3]|uniref:Adaptor complexes medium subunit family protein n=1 Tax=Trichomonas vaginalis (strain ATCC PRA-98 / G3) TaxID=412133 RepID=A2DPT4_TRIV3|nr:endocytosis [Trichomonas vaginalis G3]EAY17530.1 Adaptor complexes medium subunit family protein [Trichomonas vaginalis G3]KAI5520574.1 endocytosis [Trichomonas vaginalis G3]|eukprot:XP_001329665.1 Adaptor complexes medium subunit family protein [Trichomonas vaginalis G3]
MISAIALIDSTGELIVLKTYRKDFNQSAFDNYRLSVIAPNEITSPIVLIDGTSFLHHEENEIFYVGCTKQNAGADVIFELLNQIPKILAKVLNVSALSDKNVRDYVPDIVEIFDEMIDSGYPQCTEPETLKILTGHASPNSTQLPNPITSMATGSTPWRLPNISHNKPTVIVDVTEKVSLFQTPTGQTLNHSINGVTTMNAVLSGMSECKIEFKDKPSSSSDKGGQGGIDFDDIIFHQCVRLNRFQTNKEISFIPPDDKFELMRYKRTENVQAPFEIVPTVKDLGGNKLEISISVTATYNSSLKATHFTLHIPLPQNTANVTFECAEKTRAKFDELKNAAVWTINDFVGQGHSQIVIIAQYLSASYKSSPATKLNKPISAEFHIPKLSMSGLSILNLNVDKDKPDIYIRYATEAGKFQIMMPSPDETE